MTEMVLETKMLPEPLYSLIHSELFKLKESDGEIRLIPIQEGKRGCPLRGMFADGKLSVDKFMEQKRVEKEYEQT